MVWLFRLDSTQYVLQHWCRNDIVAFRGVQYMMWAYKQWINIAIICGKDSSSADRYEARNGALRSIARRRDLSEADVAALMAYLRSHDDSMRVERIAALKNDVMNLLRNQEPSPKGLAETLIAMFKSSKHPPAVHD